MPTAKLLSVVLAAVNPIQEIASPEIREVFIYVVGPGVLPGKI
jgi:hypothetical protein